MRCHQETFQVVRLDATACLAQIRSRASLKAGAILDGVALDAAQLSCQYVALLSEGKFGVIEQTGEHRLGLQG